MIELLGLIGGACFAYAAVPSAIKTVRAGRSQGTPIDLAWMILAGTVFLYVYLYYRYGFDPILTANYGIEFISWLIIVVYHYKKEV